MEGFYKVIGEELSIKESQVKNTIALIDEGGTVPFIARYRKEQTGNLDENQIRDILDKVTYLRNLSKRKEEVIKLIDEQGKLEEPLKKSIMDAKKLQEVEDLYLPYKKKRKTKADIAKENGLEPLALFVKESGEKKENILLEGKKYITEDVTSEEEAVEGALLILAQEISEEAKYREKIRNYMSKRAEIVVKVTKKGKELDENGTYENYYDHRESVEKAPSHRVLAINRGEKEKILNVKIELESITYMMIENIILEDKFNKKSDGIFKEVIKDALDRLILPSIEREVRNILTERAESEAIITFKKNLSSLLLQPPLNKKSILGLDPAYRTGCKAVVIDSDGFFREDSVLYLVEGMHSERQHETAKKKIKEYIKKYDIDLIAIGNGTASRETEAFIAALIKELDRELFYLIVNEAGASVYSASKIAKEEFPDLDLTVRGAISIGRRVQDPLAELVKIDPKSIGVGMYQHDVNQKELGKSLDEVVEDVVNSVGININTASAVLLSHVSGIKKNTAVNIVAHRKENGEFKERKELLKVKGIGKKAYEQMAGFLTIQDGKNPLEETIIHPESYGIALEILKGVEATLEEYKNDMLEVKERLKTFDFEKFAKEFDYGLETTKDVYKALIGERRDPREKIEKPKLKSDVLKLSDLKEGMTLEGTVRNVVSFGAFVDIGLKNDALLHISQMSKKRVEDPSEVVSIGDILKVNILEIDKKRSRVGLTLKEL